MRAGRAFICRSSALLLVAGILSACGGGGSGGGSATGPGAGGGSGSSSLVATGRQLYASQGCEDCHTLNGKLNTGPSWKGLYLSRVHLTSGKTVLANAAYLTKHIVDPDAMTVNDFPGSVMAEAIQADHLARKPADVRALVAFIESLK